MISGRSSSGNAACSLALNVREETKARASGMKSFRASKARLGDEVIQSLNKIQHSVSLEKLRL